MNGKSQILGPVIGCQPSEEFELTISSLGARIETHGLLILRILSDLTVNSQDDSHFELATHTISLL